MQEAHRCESDRGGEGRDGGWGDAKGPSTTLSSEVFESRHFSETPALPSSPLPSPPLPSAGSTSVSGGFDGQSVNVRGRERKTKKIKAQTILEKNMQRERESMRQILSLPEAGGGGGVLVYSQQNALDAWSLKPATAEDPKIPHGYRMADPRTTSIVGGGGERAGGGGGSGGDTTRIVIRHGAFVFRKTIPSIRTTIPSLGGIGKEGRGVGTAKGMQGVVSAAKIERYRTNFIENTSYGRQVAVGCASDFALGASTPSPFALGVFMCVGGVCLFFCLFVCLCVCVCVYICILCVYVFRYVYMYVCVYIYITS